LANNFLGFQAGQNSNQGVSNNFIGSQAGFLNTCGSFNNFFGSQAGFCNTTGSNNTYIGSSAGFFNTEGYSNIAIGPFSLHKNTKFFNIAIGVEAGCNLSGGAAGGDGANNILIGTAAGGNLTTGNNNILIGGAAVTVEGLPTVPLVPITTQCGQILIGNICTTKFYTKMAITGGGGNLVCFNAQTYELYSQASSCKFKDNIKPFLSGISEILNLEPVTFNYIDRPEDPEQIGFIAEQLDELDLTHFVNYDGNNEPNGISYDKLIVLAVNAIKELHEENQQLKQEIVEIKKHLDL